MIEDIGIVASLLSQVIALNFSSVDFSNLPVLTLFVLTLQLSLKCSRDYSRRKSGHRLKIAACLVLVNLLCAYALLSQVSAPYSAFGLLVLVYVFAGVDSMPPIHFHYNGLGVVSYFSLQAMMILFSTEVLCNYVSFSSVLEFVPTYLMYQSYQLAQEVTTMETDNSLHLFTLAIVLGRYDSMRFTCLIGTFAYLFNLIDISFKSYWRGLVIFLMPMMLKNCYLFMNFKLTQIPGQYLKFFLLYSAVSVISFKLSS
jgi:1,4-dihydroxy-2-naphthoate octaprenyltransferase